MSKSKLKKQDKTTWSGDLKKPNDLYNFIYQYPTKYKQGFIDEELESIIKQFKKFNRKKFDDAMIGNTCAMQDNKLVMYHCDVFAALSCGIENRNLRPGEWD